MQKQPRVRLKREFLVFFGFSLLSLLIYALVGTRSTSEIGLTIIEASIIGGTSVFLIRALGAVRRRVAGSARSIVDVADTQPNEVSHRLKAATRNPDRFPAELAGIEEMVDIAAGDTDYFEAVLKPFVVAISNGATPDESAEIRRKRMRELRDVDGTDAVLRRGAGIRKTNRVRIAEYVKETLSRLEGDIS